MPNRRTRKRTSGQARSHDARPYAGTKSRSTASKRSSSARFSACNLSSSRSPSLRPIEHTRKPPAPDALETDAMRSSAAQGDPGLQQDRADLKIGNAGQRVARRVDAAPGLFQDIDGVAVDRDQLRVQSIEKAFARRGENSIGEGVHHARKQG